MLGLTLLAAAAAAGGGTPAARAAATERLLTDDERYSLLHGVMPLALGRPAPPTGPDAVPGAGYVAGVPRLGVPSLRETDASLGVANPMDARPGDTATALPAGLMLAATFDPALARTAGAVAGAEARAKGFNVLLGGGANLARDPRGGRNFEYLSEDPLLTGIMAGAAIAGTQGEGVISTVKHFALNDQETGRQGGDAVIDRAALRESDLLAFQIAIERGQPGAVMCAYNRVNGDHACGNEWLLNDVLKRDWAYPGFVMSDWGAVHGVDFAAKGLDQQSGSQLDEQPWFGAPLRAEVAAGRVPAARISDMARRVLHAVYQVGADRPAPPGPPDLAAHRQAALQVARAGIVLLKNDGALPLPATARTIAVIGGRANLGVLSGGGSSQVTPVGGYAASVPLGGEGMMAAWRTEQYMPSPPLEELRKRLPGARLLFDPGVYAADAAALARRADVAVVFVTKHELEGYDSPDLSLPGAQDAIVRAAAEANPNTIVVLETGNPVAMPWQAQVKAILAAWYPGQAGGQAIAEVLTGAVNPSGRLPITFPASLDDIPRTSLPGYGAAEGTPVTIRYDEGADTGYRWYARTGRKPLYAFGHGLSYTRFGYSGLKVTGGKGVAATFTVRNEGEREGADVPQLYLDGIAGRPARRLLGFERVVLKPGESRTLTLSADPRLLASFDEGSGRWRIARGAYRVMLARAADAPVDAAVVTLAGRSFR